ncbi:unnamed protein product, partial [Ixodes hexagonus]
STNYTNRPPRVLLWTPFFGQWLFGLHGSWERDVRLTNCPYECYVTNDRSLLNQSEAVVFHVRDWRVEDLPSVRTPSQKWVWAIWESPEHTFFYEYHKIKHTFNWTMTYRRDSDVPVAYGNIVKRDVMKSKKDHVALWKAKSTMAIWLASHCNATSGRDLLVQSLQEHMQVDIYGMCGNYRCPKQISNLCYKVFEREYFFILVFENSICRDYASEKLFRALDYAMIPVVFGGANYSEMAPPGSYIDALNFRTPGDLAEYLKQVTKNATLYASYFEWKTQFKVVHTEHLDLCPLCAKLHSTDFKRTTSYEDLWRWWQSEGRCWRWKP